MSEVTQAVAPPPKLHTVVAFWTPEWTRLTSLSARGLNVTRRTFRLLLLGLAAVRLEEVMMR